MRILARFPTVVVMAALLAGCESAPKNEADAAGFVRGTAKVISVDPMLGQAVLDINGQRVYGYWQTQSTLANEGSVIDNGPLQPKVGAYKEPVARPHVFGAQPGDKIEFIGMRTGNDLFIRSVSVVSH